MHDQPTAQGWAGLLPDGTLPHVEQLLARHPVTVRLSRPRRSKLGDHRPPHRGRGHHRITVNDNLNPYAFLTTLLHEIAHVTTWEKWRLRIRRYRPHGREWKQEFERVLAPVVSGGVLPDDITAALAAFMQNPAAASCSDRRLMLALGRYDREEPGRPRLEELAAGAVFRVDGGQVFRMSRRLRSRYQCFELSTGREYRVHSLCRVEPLPKPPSAGRPHSALRRSPRARRAAP